MGRLFWKFFAFFWLAQLTSMIGFGLFIWFKSAQIDPVSDPKWGRPPPGCLPQPEMSKEIGGEGGAKMASELGAKADAPPVFRAGMPPPPPDHSPALPIMPLVAGALASLVFAALLAAYVSRPIRNLRSALEAAADGKLEQRLVPAMGRRRDELADLCGDFDRMAQQLSSLMDGQRRLLHDVSHELRSPLARLQAAIGLVRQQPERAEDFVARIERESARMDTLVSELLTLSRLEAGMSGQLDEDVDVSELLENVLDDACFEADACGCRVEYVGKLDVWVRGDPELLHRALENIVRNALKHSPQGKDVEIRVAELADPARVEIRVLDQGPGVAEADLQAIFEPFFRSRNNLDQEGHGLGLAISQRVVSAHQGSITACNRPAGGLMVTVVLPMINP